MQIASRVYSISFASAPARISLDSKMSAESLTFGSSFGGFYLLDSSGVHFVIFLNFELHEGFSRVLSLLESQFVQVMDATHTFL